MEDVHQVRLMALLRDLVREKRVKGAAVALDIDPRTLTSGLTRRKLSRRMSDALERLLLTGGAPAEELRNERIEGLEQRISAMGERIEAVAEELRSGLDEMRTAVEHDVNALREELEQPAPGSHRSAAAAEFRQPAQGGGSPTMPEPEDEEFYGPVWPVIAEWRALRSGHPNRGNGLSWLLDEERLRWVRRILTLGLSWK